MQWRPHQRPSHEDVLRRKEEVWRQALPDIRQGLISRAPYIAGYRRQQHAANEQQIKHAISHALSIACTDCPATSFTLISKREVECWTLADFHKVQLLTMVCPCGKVQHELPPTHIGFFGNTPEQPKVIFEADLLRSFRHSWMTGMSASNFCSAMTRL